MTTQPSQDTPAYTVSEVIDVVRAHYACSPEAGGSLDYEWATIGRGTATYSGNGLWRVRVAYEDRYNRVYTARAKFNERTGTVVPLDHPC